MDTNGNSKELLLKDLCSRLPYGVNVRYKSVEGEGDIKLGYGNLVYVSELRRGWVMKECKPYLRPLSSMTEEEKDEFDKLMNLVEERCINAYGKGGYTLSFTELNDWLNAHHFDYRGLIEKGLALEAQKDMYKTK